MTEGEQMTETDPTTEEPAGEDGHTVTVDDSAGDWQATATCSGCDWEGRGWVVFLRSEAAGHEAGTDGYR